MTLISIVPYLTLQHHSLRESKWRHCVSHWAQRVIDKRSLLRPGKARHWWIPEDTSISGSHPELLYQEGEEWRSYQHTNRTQTPSPEGGRRSFVRAPLRHKVCTGRYTLQETVGLSQSVNCRTIDINARIAGPVQIRLDNFSFLPKVHGIGRVDWGRRTIVYA